MTGMNLKYFIGKTDILRIGVIRIYRQKIKFILVTFFQNIIKLNFNGMTKINIKK